MENNILLYTTETSKVNVKVTYLNDTFWLSQKLIAELFDCSTDNVSLHLKNIFSSGETSIQLPRNSRQLLVMGKSITFLE